MRYILLFISSYSLGCDFSTIREIDNEEFVYSKAQHLCVKDLLDTNKLRELEVKELNNAIKLKDLAYKYSSDRANLAEELAIKNTERLNSIQKSSEYQNYIFFGGGILAAILINYVNNKTR
jgi:predicted nucleotidyltransferase component of viral defense system